MSCGKKRIARLALLLPPLVALIDGCGMTTHDLIAHRLDILTKLL